MNVADPHDSLGEVVGVRVNLDAVKLERADLGELRGEAMLAQKVVHLLFEFQEFLEGDVEEVAGTAGGVEHTDGLQAFEKGEDKFLGLSAGLLGAGGQQPFRPGADLGPFAAQRHEDDGFDDGLDVRAARVMRAKLGAFGGIEAALEEGAGNGNVHRAPIFARRRSDGFNFLCGQFKHGSGVEQAAVEMADAFNQEIPAGGHGAEQLADVAGEFLRVITRAFEDPCE